jgi:protein-L-isoaspartate(D-aspartate) O-methyltransferase
MNAMMTAAMEKEAQERAQFTLRMRSRGLQDLRVLRALERTPRSFFVPQRYADIAGRDIALPIGGGQTAPPPSTVAAMIEALRIEPSHRVLEIGTGSGYATALLGQIASDVVSLERSASLAIESRARIGAFGLGNVRVYHADGLADSPEEGPFDRILVHALIEPPAPRLTRWLEPGGALVAAIVDEDQQRIVRLTRDAEGGLAADAFGAVRTLMPLVVGRMRAL